MRKDVMFMATTAQWVYDRAIHLMDEQSEAGGQTCTEDTREYRLRTLSILNILRHELFPLSDTYRLLGCRRPVCPELTDFDQEIGLDDPVAQGILPYGLAAHLLLGENNPLANYFSQRYLELMAQLRASLPARWESIAPAYGRLDVS